ncbi:NnrU family protein [Tropicimonas sp. S265A]|uniref:NnrU family protein n=1 Tax=Tropicimonas sp. S265A TaxID=3415134 RepID=UPI003C7A0686
MYFTILALGLALWSGAHFFKRLAPEKRAAMGDKGKGVVAVAIVAAIVLMVIGYRGADFIPVWSPPPFLTHVNNTLMVFALWMFGAAKSGVWPATKIRHPQLASIKTFALAHLLVNGDLASILLFGGLLAWSVVSVILINKAEPDWTPPAAPPTKKLVTTAIITVVVFFVITFIHNWLGVWPFPA